MTEKKKQKVRRQIQESRFRLISMTGFFAEPLMDLTFVDSPMVKRISVGKNLMLINGDWFSKLGKTETDYILAHELMHLHLKHIDRPKYFRGDRFHLAADIVANAGLDILGWRYERLTGIGRIYRKTFYPEYSGSSLRAEEAVRYIPFDPSTMSEGVRRTYMIDSEEAWEIKENPEALGEILLRIGESDPDDLKAESTFGGNYVEELRNFILSNQTISGEDEEEEKEESEKEKGKGGTWEHIALGDLEQLRNEKQQSVKMPYREGEIRKWQRLHDTELDWRELLNFFVQETIDDYSFTPPDKRYSEGDFFLPDYNEASDDPREVLFMVDTSGSIDAMLLERAYSEIRQALEQFGGKLKGAVGFFDVRVYEPVSFDNLIDLESLIPKGGGGTSYTCIFDHVKEMAGAKPMSIVIFTDGEAGFPSEDVAMGIPVLWLFTNEKASAPWGRSARLTADTRKAWSGPRFR